jgi:hypothetical protein
MTSGQNKIEANKARKPISRKNYCVMNGVGCDKKRAQT